MLFLVLDGVPWDLAQDLWHDGLFPDYAPPRPMVSVFPSLTHVAMPALLGSVFDRKPPGYEVRYHHPPSGEIRGGFGDPEAEAVMTPYHARPHGTVGHAAVYILSRALAFGQIRWIGRQFERGPGPWLGYLAATDGIGHFGGPDAMRDAVVDILDRVEQAREEYGNRHGVRPGAVLCSDHGFGFAPRPFRHTDLRTMARVLADAGFSPDGSGRDAVHLVGMGAVGGGVIHCGPARATEVAEVVAGLEAVDLAFGREGPHAALAFARRERMERARIRWRGDRYRYDALDGDPLGWVDLQARLGGGWIDDDTLLRETWDAPYPYAPPRVRHGMDDVVQWPAQVLFSMRPGHSYGPRLTHAGARLRGGQVGTHGALDRDQTLGFAIATEAWDDLGGVPVRPAEVFAPWADLVRAGSAIGEEE
ncbi:MAG: hypothetical protein ACQEXJ_15370 [Myxococcota bacterium]